MQAIDPLFIDSHQIPPTRPCVTLQEISRPAFFQSLALPHAELYFVSFAQPSQKVPADIQGKLRSLHRYEEEPFVPRNSTVSSRRHSLQVDFNCSAPSYSRLQTSEDSFKSCHVTGLAYGGVLVCLLMQIYEALAIHVAAWRDEDYQHDEFPATAEILEWALNPDVPNFRMRKPQLMALETC